MGGVYYLHTLTYSLSAFVAGLQVGFLSTVLIAINNFRDMHQDKVVNKNTLAVRFGAQFSKIEILSLFIFSILLGSYWIQKGFIAVAFLPLLSVPLMKNILVGVFKNKPGIIFNKCVAQSALVQVLFAVLMAVGFVVS